MAGRASPADCLAFIKTKITGLCCLGSGASEMLLPNTAEPGIFMPAETWFVLRSSC